MKFNLDRSLTVPVGAQLRGQIEYSVAVGDLRPGQRLPTVRDLADSLGVSPVTVSNVYRDLQHKGIVTSTVGRGTFVNAITGLEPGQVGAQAEVQRAVDQLIRVGQMHGLSTADLVERLQATVAVVADRSVRALLVGIFPAATRAYAESIEQFLGPGGKVDAITFDEIESDEAGFEPTGYDVLLTIVYLVPKLERLVAGRVPVKAIKFLPSEQTRLMLSQLQPTDRVAVVATYPEYLAALKSTVMSFAPHVDVVASHLLDEFDPKTLVGNVDVLVYATGSDGVLPRLPSGVRSFEYRHEPDPRYTVDAVLGRDLRVSVASAR